MKTDFDGIICFGGEDWWYHNRGHNDIRFMLELSQDMPILFINSIGLRTPKISGGKDSLGRIIRKIKSLRKGLTHIQDNFWVMTPFVIPGKYGAYLSGQGLPFQVRKAAKKLGMKKPLLWIVPPSAKPYVAKIPHVGLVFQRSDRLEIYKGVDVNLMTNYVNELRRQSDLTIYCNRQLMANEIGDTNHSVFIDHGVNFDDFASKGRGDYTEPSDLVNLARPRAGFIGGLEPHTFDPPLFLKVAELLPEVQFMMVGRNGLGDDWCELSNVHFYGMKKTHEVAAYMASCDVLLMPWNQSDWIRDCNPIKLKEYLAIGRPIVSTYFNELEHYKGLVRVAKTAEKFADEIKFALDEQHDEEKLRTRVEGESWAAKVAMILDNLAAKGFVYRKSGK